LGAGGGIVLLGEFLDTSFKDAAELENYTDVSVICSIPRFLTINEGRRQKLISILWGGFFASMILFLMVGGALLWKKGMIVF
jgi:hypothetical protein